MRIKDKIINAIAWKLGGNRKDEKARYMLWMRGIYVKVSPIIVYMCDELVIDAKRKYDRKNILKALEGLEFKKIIVLNPRGTK